MRVKFFLNWLTSVRTVIGFLFSAGSVEVNSKVVEISSLEVYESVGVDVEANSFVPVTPVVMCGGIVVKVIVLPVELDEVCEDNLVVFSGVVSGTA